MTDQPARVPAQTSPASPSATAAYVRIYEEEQPRLVAYARSLTRNTWAAEDLVSEAHFRVWRRLSAGHEIDNVPAYLMTTVRHLASSVASATHETPRDPQVPEQAFGSPVRHADDPADPAEQVSSTDLLVRVLGELPERWVQALWLADAEGQPLESVGRQIGAKQGATAVLLHRAREGMRQAFLRSQTEAPDDPACEVHWVRMPAYVRGNATPRQSERLLAHVDTCDGCRGRLAVLIRANNRLPALVGPALLVFVVGGGGTGKFLASLTAGSVGAAGSAGSAGSLGSGGVFGSGGAHGLLRTARAAGPKTKAVLASGTAAAAAVAIVIALGVNESPATATVPGRAPVAQAPAAGPSTGTAGEQPGTNPPAGERDRTRDDDTGAVVAGGGADVSDVQLVADVQGDGGSGGPGDSGNSGNSGGSDGGSGGGGTVDDPPPPGEPAPGAPDPGPSPSPVGPTPGGEAPTPPTEQTPEPEPDPVSPEPKPKPTEPVTPGDGTPVPEPTPATPTPADPDPAGETPEPPTYSEPSPSPAPESPEPSEPSEPPAAPEPPSDPPVSPAAPETPSDPPTSPAAPEVPSDPPVSPTAPESPSDPPVPPPTPEPPTPSEPSTDPTPAAPPTPPTPPPATGGGCGPHPTD
ncbi:sigma-70 family RNA polymerase sigma factor [Streptomyces sp. NPDC005374]|uniref:sigma-70 family RNA polymerase sigma factor n=1 Tax=Streptomyces sp. NPDC005374 TaxID=3364713 RepID=UPI00368E38DB